MNVFFLNEDPEIAATWLCDKHAWKMIVETAQILCTVHHIVGSPMIFSENFYKPTHIKHPCCKWAASDPNAYDWLFNHYCILYQRYRFCFNRDHKCSTLHDSLENYPEGFLKGDYEDLDESKVPLCMPAQYKVEGNPIFSYKRYYVGEKLGFAKWKYFPYGKPSWVDDPKYRI